MHLCPVRAPTLPGCTPRPAARPCARCCRRPQHQPGAPHARRLNKACRACALASLQRWRAAPIQRAPVKPLSLLHPHHSVWRSGHRCQLRPKELFDVLKEPMGTTTIKQFDSEFSDFDGDLDGNLVRYPLSPCLRSARARRTLCRAEPAWQHAPTVSSPPGRRAGGASVSPCHLAALLTKGSDNVFRVGIFLDFASSSTRTPHAAYVRVSGRNRIDPHWVEIERLTTRVLPTQGGGAAARKASTCSGFGAGDERALTVARCIQLLGEKAQPLPACCPARVHEIDSACRLPNAERSSPAATPLED